ncbi:unnamed protein product [Sympodiomycopsis kandeliae]
MFNSPSRASTPRRSHIGGPRPSSIRGSRAGTPAGPGPSSASAASSSRPQSPALSAAAKRRSYVRPGARDFHNLDDNASDSQSVASGYTNDADLTAGAGTVAPATTALSPGHILKRDDYSAVTVFSSLPRDVITALEASDPYIDAVTGHLDVQTGYGVLVNSKTCYVWSFANRSAFSTCYTFQTASQQNGKTAIHALPHAALVPRSSEREPGLLLASVDGQIRFWDSISASLTGQERSQTLNVALGANENIVGLTRTDAATYIVATSQSRLFRISVASSGGRLVAQITAFAQSRGIFGRWFGGGAAAAGQSSASAFSSASEGIVSVVACPSVPNQGSRDIFAIGQRMVQKWRIADGGSERLLGEQDIGRTIANAVMSSPDEVANLADSIGLEIIDAAARTDGSIYVLYSYVKQPNRPLAYGMATVSCPSDHGSFLVAANDIFEYTGLRDPRPYSSPRLVVPNGGPAVFVAFADALLLILTANDDLERFEDRIVLKDSARNRFLGCGYEGVDVEPSNSSLAALSCLSAQSGALLVEFDIEAARKFASRSAEPAERQAAFNERLQNQLEQVVFFDEGESNPLSFAISSRRPLQGDLESVAERISSEIVSATSRHLPQLVDLREQIAHRLSYLVKVIEALNTNHLVSLLGHRSRSRLCADAQLVSAGADLWRHYNQRMGSSRFGGQGIASPLAEAIEDVMAGQGQPYDQDLVRMFFRSQLAGIVALFENLQARLKAAEAEPFDVKVDTISELGRIALTAFGAADRYKQISSQQYVLDNRTSYEAWTCRPISLQLLESLFVATEKLIHDRSRELGGRVDAETVQGDSEVNLFDFNLQKELKTNLCELAKCTLISYEERISYLASSSDGDKERERSITEAKYQTLRPKLLKPLVVIGRADRAFNLAERHGDFRTLTELCVDPSTGNPEGQIQYYLRRYGKPFAFELFQYYVQTEQYKKLLSPSSEWNGLLNDFLKDTENTRISWLHDLKLHQYQEASSTLLSEAEEERQDLKTKHVFLSLGKLSYLSELSEEQIGSVEEQERIGVIDDQLDLVTVHEKLKEVFRSCIEEQMGGLSDQQGDVSRLADIVVDTLMTARAGDEAYTSHFHVLTTSLLSGGVLTSEDLIDLLTLKDTSTRESVTDFTLALQVCLRASAQLQSTRLEAMLHSIWRRSILSDNWPSITATKDASDEEMQRRLESSAFYQTLYQTLHDHTEDDSDASILQSFVPSLDELLTPPEKSVIQARIENTTKYTSIDTSLETYVELLMADIEAEVEMVRELVGQGEEVPLTGQWIREAMRRAEKGVILGREEVDMSQ